MQALAAELGASPQRIAAIPEDMQQAFDDYDQHIVVHRGRDGIVGVCWVKIANYGHGYVEQLWVRADVRGCGLGAELLRRGEAWLRLRGCLDLHLHAAKRAMTLYQRAGYTGEFEMSKKL